MTSDTLAPAYAAELLDIARRSISHGVYSGGAAPADCPACSAELQRPQASFVTLQIGGELRGCIGSLHAHRALAEDVMHNAHAAAFRDPRFMPVTRAELDLLDVGISLLSAPVPLIANTQAELLAQLVAGVDGLILEAGARSSTFLPSVWEQLPEPEDFLAHLKRKAGLRADYWSDEMRFLRYRAEHIG